VRRRRRGLACLPLALLAAGAGCSGETVVGVLGVEPDAGACLHAPTPVGTVDPSRCVVPPLDPCDFTCNDDGGHGFGQRCWQESCECFYDGAYVCGCRIEGTGTICGGSVPPCCPPPWQAP
jgi:hypothetical protein